MARIRAVLRRRTPEQSGQRIQHGDLMIDSNAHSVSYKGEAIKLGPTEFKLLNFFMHHPDRVHSRSQLLDRVWGDHVYIEERTVDVHIKRLREQLGSAGAMIVTVRGAGYKFNSTT
jgi:two-component system phosphate regulon response regulator PhoB